ncbi:unnamed protein product [Lupinus luteus]|uniref:Uncharacterized protein n=1 Tax=Lupinus luteus TaxID=3873 RepID=A0AAV1W717_LUPLU
MFYIAFNKFTCMTQTKGLFCVSLFTLLLLSHWFPTLANEEHEQALSTKTNVIINHQYQPIEKKVLAYRNLFIHNRKLGFSIKKKKKKKKKHGKKSSAIGSGISMSHVKSIFCTSILIGFLLI